MTSSVAGGAPLRITMVLNSLLAGGAERVAVQLLGELAGRGHELTLITLADRQTDVFHPPPTIHRVALDVVGSSSGPVDALRRNLRRVTSLRRALVATTPDVVLSFQTTVNVTTLVALAGTRVPVVVSERVDPRVHRLPAAWTRLRRLWYPRASALVVQTHNLRAWGEREMRRGRVDVIANPVTLRAEAPGERDAAGRARLRLVAVGRLEPQKGFDLLVDAFARVAPEADRWDLVVLGEGSCRGALEAQVRALGLVDRVRLPGFCADVSTELSRADAFALSSRYEGFPNALLEAMAHGLPVVAARCPSGPEEIVEDGRTGLLTACESVDDLVACLRRVLLDARLRAELGAAATSVRTRYALPTVADQWEQLLGWAARSRPRRLYRR